MEKITDKEWFLKEKERLEKDPEYLTDWVVFVFTEELLKYMEVAGMNKKDLAKKLNCSQAYITKLFRGNPNLTVKKMVELALVFNERIHIQFRNPVSARPAIQLIAKSSQPFVQIETEDESEYWRNIEPGKPISPILSGSYQSTAYFRQ